MSEPARRLRKRREELGLNQTELGLIAGVHRATVRAWEIGRTVEGKTQTAILRALGCSEAPLLTYEEGAAKLTIQPRLSAGVARIIAMGILRVLREQPDSPAASTVVQDYMELVAAADVDHPSRLPISFARLCDQLAISATELAVVEMELKGIFSDQSPKRDTQRAAGDCVAESWRTGTSPGTDGLTLYRHTADGSERGRLVGMMREPADAALVVEAVNAHLEGERQRGVDG